MGASTSIAWCHSTFNAWHGCAKVSPACKNCYAEAFNKRVGGNHWGVSAPRRFFGEKHWGEPLKWNREAEKAGERRRVFCGSMMDVFEIHPSTTESGMQLVARTRLWQLIDSTPWLDWLLLTKRPENAEAVLPLEWWRNGLPHNVWMGTTVENQEYANLRIPQLMSIPARVRFLSCEPLLGWVRLDRPLLVCGSCLTEHVRRDRVDWLPWEDPTKVTWRHQSLRGINQRTLDWVIVGGESGHGHREHQLEWARLVRDQCAAAGVPFFFKQLGEDPTEPGGVRIGTEIQHARGEAWTAKVRKRLPLARRSKGESLDEIPPDLRIRQFPQPKATT
jgi:protein gp37